MIELKITGMDCADCAATLEKGVGQLEGVEAIRVNYLTGQMKIEGSPELDAVEKRVKALGYGVADGENASKLQPKTQPSGVMGFVHFMLQRRDTSLALVGLAALVVSMGILLANGSEIVAHAIQAIIVIFVGFPIMRLGIQQLFLSRRVTINLLMTIATIGAILIGEWSEAATVITLFAIGEALEGYSADRARGALHSLLTLSPQEALVIRPCMDCQGHMGKDGYTGGACPWCEPHEHPVPVEEVKLGEMAIILPASRIPLDGKIIQGSSTVDQSHITGESIPVAKTLGDEVYAGSINGAAALHIEVTNLAQDSTLARIIRLVENAQMQKSPTERFVDKFATYYTPAVIVIAILVALVPPVLFNGVFDTWIYRALALLVVACPCSLVISTPVTVVSAMVRAAKQGILIKGGAHLENLGRIKAIAFDKTGTLTEGKPQVLEVTSLGCTGDEVCNACGDMLGFASAVERQSEHPLGRAVVQAAQKYGVLDRFAPAQNVAIVAGKGVQGQVAAHPITIGSHPWFDATYPHEQVVCENILTHENNGKTVMLIADSENVLGFITVADTPRDSARNALSQLAGIHKIMLTGDNPTVANVIAKQVGINEVKAGLLPEEKLDAVRELGEKYGAVAMVGDGVNDAPALAAATVGIAIGGTAQAMETADVVLMQEDLNQLPKAIQISQKARKLIQQNIALSLLIKALFLLLTLPGLTTLWMAVLADVGMSLLVTLNGMRSLRGSHQENGVL